MSLDHIRGASKQVKQLARKYMVEGWAIDWLNGGHLRWRGPHGELVVSSGTPSDWHAIARIERDIRRETNRKLSK